MDVVEVNFNLKIPCSVLLTLSTVMATLCTHPSEPPTALFFSKAMSPWSCIVVKPRQGINYHIAVKTACWVSNLWRIPREQVNFYGQPWILNFPQGRVTGTTLQWNSTLDCCPSCAHDFRKESVCWPGLPGPALHPPEISQDILVKVTRITLRMLLSKAFVTRPWVTECEAHSTW